MVIEFAGRDSSNDLALCLREKGNKRKCIASGGAPFLFNVSASWMNTFGCCLGFSVGRPANWFCCKICNNADFIQNC